MKRQPFAPNYASWHAHLAARRALRVPRPVETARVIHLDYAAWHARLVGADRKAA